MPSGFRATPPKISNHVVRRATGLVGWCLYLLLNSGGHSDYHSREIHFGPRYLPLVCHSSGLATISTTQRIPSSTPAHVGVFCVRRASARQVWPTLPRGRFENKSNRRIGVAVQTSADRRRVL